MSEEETTFDTGDVQDFIGDIEIDVEKIKKSLAARIDRLHMKEAVAKIKGLIDMQKRKGTYDYNEHMFGVLIGLELAYYSLLGEEAQYTEKPEKWLSNKAYNDFVPEVANIQKANMYGEVYPQYPFDTSS